MGEAKRRKKAGPYPNGGRIEDFRVPAGKLAITVDIDDTAPSTVLFDATKIAEILNEAARHFAGDDYYKIVRMSMRAFLKIRRQKGDLTGVGIAILWSVFHHPTTGADTRQIVSRRLREGGKVHITWKFSSTYGLGITVADQFVDLDDILPPGTARSAGASQKVGATRTGLTLNAA
jgi:hypothetical protein